MSSLIKKDDEYRRWIEDVSKRFREGKLKAAVKVNDEMLRFYYSVGRDISLMIKDAKYGSGFYKTVSGDLMKIFPNVHSFSVTNLKYMRYFFELYNGLLEDFSKTQNRQQAVDDFGNDAIFNIPWGHQMLLISKCKNNPEKAFFYVKKTIENNWLRAMLLNFLDTDLYERQGKAITNFSLRVRKILQH